jgi:3-methylcrotonyl-CoA carboxylase alpha subunit
MFERLLVANRGEIACRVIDTCRRLGIRTIAVYSSADASARHVRLADEAMEIGPAAATESYLRSDRILEVADQLDADAIHPGYGFLSENAGFADSCVDAGVAWVGPTAETIRSMGSKSRARRIMQEAGVAVVPGYDDEEQDDAVLLAAADRIGFPLMIKASAGGGGKGMRIVRDRDAWSAALAGARREAAAAFGDDRVILERYLEKPRHIEFQVFADSHGNAIHLFERECSIQRRYQKIIEETPAVTLGDTLRSRMGDAAVRAARAVDYVNAGTVEFLEDGGDYFFMEMNTRLQVEHPVTEATTGLDLVEWQLRVAAGETLPLTQEQVTRAGHAIEARIYAENPFEEFLPSTGTIGRFRYPSDTEEIRMDTGVEDGDTVGIHYDPMIAKIIARGDDREAAIARMREALAGTMLTGPLTNLPFLRGLVAHRDFRSADIDTGYLDRHLDVILEGLARPGNLALALAACVTALDRSQPTAREEDADRYSPWERTDGWRLGGGATRMAFEDRNDDRHEVRLSGWNGHFQAEVGDDTLELVVSKLDDERISFEIDRETQEGVVIRDGNALFVSAASDSCELRLVPLYGSKSGRGEEDTHPGAPMPGRIVVMHVEVGQVVDKGQPLLVLEGMKMEYTLTSPATGVVAGIHCAEGDLVEAEVPLVDIDPQPETGEPSG